MSDRLLQLLIPSLFPQGTHTHQILLPRDWFLYLHCLLSRCIIPDSDLCYCHYSPQLAVHSVSKGVWKEAHFTCSFWIISTCNQVGITVHYASFPVISSSPLSKQWEFESNWWVLSNYSLHLLLTLRTSSVNKLDHQTIKFLFLFFI